MVFQALFVDLESGALVVLRQDENHALGLFAVERFRAPLFGGLYFRVVHGAPRPKMLVALPHVAVREPGALFLKHVVDELVQIVDVARERVAILHDAYRHGQLFIVFL